ncbi:MAG: hypothetical protein IPP60_07105 [Sphingobacteriales bacterium]|jgi:molybdopterin-containing oxidoreductase family membrane subunit|nr:hypothetical protein [Sphingobacteriales bacterium]
MYSFYNLVVLLTTPFKCGYPLFILFLLLISKTQYKERFDVKLALVIANWLLLFSSVTVFLLLFFELFPAWYSGNMYESYAFASRSGISYKLYFITLTISNFIPILFLFRKLRENIICSLFVALLTLLFLYQEVIRGFLITHQDYLPSSWVDYRTLPEKIFLNPITQTIFLSLIVLIIYRIKKRNK